MGEFIALGLRKDSVDSILKIISCRDINEFSAMVGESTDGLQDLISLFELANGYGFNDWLVFDPSIVRGLSYYTGTVFEGFDRKGEFRAILGGGRYDKLLETYGGDSIPAVGFGFGDAVIVELLKSKDLLPDFSKGQQAQIVVYAMDSSLKIKACQTASFFRDNGFSVDIIADNKKPKWVFQRANNLQAG